MDTPTSAIEYSITERPAHNEERTADRRRYRRSASRSRSRSSPRSASRSRSPRPLRSRSASSHRSYRTPEESWARPDELHYRPALILKGHKRGVSGVKFSPDGKRIASCSADGMIKIWDAETGRLEHTLEGHMAGISCIAWSPDSTVLASGSDDKVIRLWDVVKVSFTLPLLARNET
jgi:COMPASS component SWD3